jgi:hypothetical protein
VKAAVLLLAAAGTAAGGLPPGYEPRPVGPSPAYRPSAVGPLAPPRGLPCRRLRRPETLVHVELFVHRYVVVVPAGIGIARPRRHGAYVTGGACHRPLYTLEPTGVVHVPAGRPATLGALFAVWRMPLGPKRLAGFGGQGVRVYVGGRRVTGDVRHVPLRPHGEIVLELGGYVAPHHAYTFPGRP